MIPGRSTFRGHSCPSGHLSATMRRVVEEEPLRLGEPGRSLRRTRGRPSPWLFLTLAMLWTGLAASCWILGEDLPLSIGSTVLAVAYFWMSWHARRHANDPLRPGRGATSRWGAGRPDERWR
jgi:hypothetical protein